MMAGLSNVLNTAPGPLCCAKRSHNQGLPLHTITSHNHLMPSSHALCVCAPVAGIFLRIFLAFNEVLARWQCDGWEMYQHYLPSLSRLDRFNILRPGPISGWSPSYQTHNRWTERETAGWPGANPWNLNVKVWIFWSGLINERRWAIRPSLAGSASFITSRNIGY